MFTIKPRKIYNVALLCLLIFVAAGLFNHLRTETPHPKAVQEVPYNTNFKWKMDESLQQQWPEKFRKCLQQPDYLERNRKFPTKHPSFGLVQTISTDRADEEFDYVSSMNQCYCKKHGCDLHQNIIAPEQYSKWTDSFFTARWVSIKERFWHRNDLLFLMDADAVFVDYDKDIANHSWKHAEHASVILHSRRNFEVMAGFIGFNTHDRFASCFMDQWISLGKENKANRDNGDLLETILMIAAPDLYKECHPLRTEDQDFYNAYFIPCFSKVYSRFSTAQRKHEPSSKMGIGPGGIPIRIVMYMDSQFGDFEGIGENIYAHYKLSEGSVIAHGYKQIGKFFVTPEVYHCQEPPNGKLGVPKLWLNVEQTLAVAKDCCWWHYPHCVVDGENICRNQNHCKKDIFGLFGVGQPKCIPLQPHELIDYQYEHFD